MMSKRKASTRDRSGPSKRQLSSKEESEAPDFHDVCLKHQSTGVQLLFLQKDIFSVKSDCVIHLFCRSRKTYSDTTKELVPDLADRKKLDRLTQGKIIQSRQTSSHDMVLSASYTDERSLAESLKLCLSSANEKHCSSVLIPLRGRGKGFSVSGLATEITTAISEYLKTCPKTSSTHLQRLLICEAGGNMLRTIFGLFWGQPKKKFSQESVANEISTVPPAAVDENGGDDEEDICVICRCPPTDPKRLNCSHEFCTACIDHYFSHVKPVCPVCLTAFGTIYGDQPTNGRMTHYVTKEMHVPGYEKISNGTIVITYSFPNGKQQNYHPHPGSPYYGTTRNAYLPNCDEGRNILALLSQAFKQRLTFTVGTSLTNGPGSGDAVIWNGIHHKTSVHGGPQMFGYPDPHYLKRVEEELAARNIKHH